MARTKEVSLSIDIDELEKQLEERREESEPEGEEELDIRSTVFSFGKDPRLGTTKEVSTPDLRFLEIQKDGINNPFIELTWRVPRIDIDAVGVKGFNIYRRRVSREEITADTRDRERARLRGFNRLGLDRIARKTPNTGHFSQDRKSIFSVRRSLIPQTILNPELARFEAIAQARFNSSLNRADGIRGTAGRFASPFDTEPTLFRGSLNSFSSRRFEKLAYVDYTKFLAQEQKKLVLVAEREFVDLSFKDKKVGYGEVFEYYVVSVAEEEGESPRSNSVKVRIEDLTPITPPLELRAFQLNEREVQLRICANPQDDINRALVYRRSEDEVEFIRVAALYNVNDCLNLIDATVQYNKSYSYRVFMENIHGTLSEPGDIEITSTVQKLTPASRSNNLKIPIITAIQDQNSDFIKLTISSNDPNVSYYEVDRRDLTIHEKKFTVPSKSSTGYGGNGWLTNKLFVNRSRDVFEKNLSQEKDLLNRRGTESEIIFIDDTVQVGHIYQYRVHGCDLFCNASPYGLNLIRATGKKILRTPINLTAETLRDKPFRVKISWTNDNEARQYDPDELFAVDTELSQSDTKFIYRVQRRKLGETQYDSFPWTANKFIVDEVSSVFSTPFESKLTKDEFVRLENVEQDDAISVNRDVIERSEGMPRFLELNDIYFYRVETRDPTGEVSNFTEEFEVSTLPDISDPLNFKVEVLNVKVRPLVARLTWETATDKTTPDHWIIERKFDVDNDTFEVVGRSYVVAEFFDRGLQPGNTYLYRIKSIDNLGRESKFFDARLTL